MKKILVFATTLMLVTGFGAVWAQTDAGPYCFDFDPYCDGLELSLNPQTNMITGLWVNTDCAGTDVPITWGKLFTGPNGYGGYVIGSVYGNTYAFFLDLPLDGTMQMYMYSGGWMVWLDPLYYILIPGPCPFADNIGDPSHSTTWAE